MGYLGTKRSQVLVFDTREPQGDPIVLTFPGTERRPIISLVSVPPCPAAGLHHSGFLVLTLGSLWYWEHNMGDNTFIPHKLQTPKGAIFWSLEYEPNSRLVLVVCRPSPLSKHLVMELSSTTLPTGRVVTTNIIMESQGGSYSVRSFLRSSLMVVGDQAETVMLVQQGDRHGGPEGHRAGSRDWKNSTGAICGKASVGHQAGHHQPAELSRHLGGD